MLPTKKRGSLTVKQMKTTTKETCGLDNACTREAVRARAKRIADKINHAFLKDASIAKLVTVRANSWRKAKEKGEAVYVDWHTSARPLFIKGNTYFVRGSVCVGFCVYDAATGGFSLTNQSPTTDRARAIASRILAEEGVSDDAILDDGGIDAFVGHWTTTANSWVEARR